MSPLRTIAAVVAVLVECGDVEGAVEHLRAEMDAVWDDGFREGLAECVAKDFDEVSAR